MLKNVLKIAIIGKDYTGKSSLAYASTNRTFEIDYTPTIGVDYIVARLIKDDTEISLAFWDLSGEQRFASIILSYIRNCSLLVFCYSATSISSFEDITVRYTYYSKQGYLKDKTIIVVATKIDSATVHPDYEKWGKEFSTQHKCSFIKTSAKNKEGISEFLDLCSTFSVPDKRERFTTIDLNDKPKEKCKVRSCFFF